MNFLESFFTESLQSPWLIKVPGAASANTTELQPPLEYSTEKVFIVEPGASDQAYSMLSKMVAALKYSPSEVSFVELSDLEDFSRIAGSKKLLFFGESYPGDFGSYINWNGHRVFKTYSLQQLINEPELKKHTWAHLKTYASLK